MNLEPRSRVIGMSERADTILRVEGLKKYYDTSSGFIDSLLGRGKRVKAVEDVDLELREGETLGVVGESGCGKTTLGRSILRLIEPTDGSVYYRDEELTTASNTRLRGLKKEMQYIFQDPFASLNPRLTVGDIIGEPLEVHDQPQFDVSVRGFDGAVELTGTESLLGAVVEREHSNIVVTIQNQEVRSLELKTELLAAADISVNTSTNDEQLSLSVEIDQSKHDIREARITELLETVGLSTNHTRRYPHEFSGGQRQRIGISRALAVDPEVIVCDEPVSALDVSVQAQILNLLEDLQDEFGLSYIFIAHDLSVVEHISDRVAVMYLGEIAEVGPTEAVFSPPHHPYTEALLSAIPEPDPLWEGEQITLSGTVPSPIDPPSGCRFHTRCPRIIQPKEYDLEQTEWRSIVDLKLHIEDTESLTALATAEESVDLSAVSKDRLDELVRTKFSLPPRVSDPGAEEILLEAIDHLHAGEIDGAHERLESAFVSPCEHHPPEQYRTSETHRIACLLYEESYNDSRDTEDDDAIIEE